MTRRGFTLIELVLAVTVGGILLTIGLASFSEVENRTSARQARNVFAGLHARARAHAIEFGTTTRLEVDAAGDSAWITRDGTTVETVRFRDEFGVDLLASSTRSTLCMSPRGYADSSCTTFSTTAKITFQRSNQALSATMLPLGQLMMAEN